MTPEQRLIDQTMSLAILILASGWIAAIVIASTGRYTMLLTQTYATVQIAIFWRNADRFIRESKSEAVRQAKRSA